MDSKALRLSIAAIITTVVLIVVVVYAANKDKIDELVGNKSQTETTEEVAESEEQSTSSAYGEQIGDNLKGFLTADDFFDKSEQRPSVVVVVDNVPVPANASTEEDSTDITDLNDMDSPDTEYSYPDSKTPSDEEDMKVPDALGDDDMKKPDGDKPQDKPEDGNTSNAAASSSDENAGNASGSSSDENANTSDSASGGASEGTEGASDSASSASDGNTGTTTGDAASTSGSSDDSSATGSTATSGN